MCQEHCPTPEKAIKFEVKEVLLPDDTVRMVKYPYVVRELCIGCGICENKCPVRGLPAIRAIAAGESRSLRNQILL